MTHLSLPWSSKPTSATACSGAAPTAAAASPSASCCGLARLIRRLRKRRKMLQASSRQSSLQCRYDPLSYSLNFDRSGPGDFGDEDYYKYYAFSSRFVANQKSDCGKLVAASH